MLSFHLFQEAYKAIPGTQKGSNEGGLHHNSLTNTKHYIKYYKNGDQAKTEALTGKIYNHMGIHTLDPHYEKIGNKHAIVTPWNDDLKSMHPASFSKLNPKQEGQIGRMYHAAILTKNWDIIGLEHDNVMHNQKTGNIHAIDHGGAFEFRAQGGHKDYDPDIKEKHSLLDTSLPSGQVFHRVFSKNPKAEKEGLKAVKGMDMTHIHTLFKTSGLKNWESLHKNFVAKRDKLLKA